MQVRDGSTLAGGLLGRRTGKIAQPAGSRFRLSWSEGVKVASPAYIELIDFIAAGTTPQAVVDFHPSEQAEQRVVDLLEREQTTGLSAEERAELDHYVELEHILRVAKARARQILNRG
jgi:hypothetical protein